MASEKDVKEMIESVGGTVTEMGRLPDGSGFATASFPLRKDHWIYGDRECENQVGELPQCRYEYAPMPFRMGIKDNIIVAVQMQTAPIRILTRDEMAEIIRRVGKYAVRAATMKGSDMDFDPDALLQNLVTGFLGYWTDDGLTSDDWANPPEYRKSKAGRG